MKFKISKFNEPKHKSIVSCISWNNTEEVFSCGDDHILLKWNLVTNESLTVTTLPDNFFPTSLQPYPKTGFGSSSNKQSQDNLLLTTADGRFHFVNQNGRIEKSVAAHQGACLVGQWSPDGSSILTAGEDGTLRIWSRSGLARSLIGNVGVPIYCAIWGPSGSSLLHTQSNCIVITHLQGNTKRLQWKGHDGLILSAAWNPTNNIIVSGSEDGFFKTWDMFGQLLSCSMKHDCPILSVSWSPAGDLFAVAGYNLLRLCDFTGWSHCLERPNTGSIQHIAWSSDGTQLAAACSNGHVLFAHLIQRQMSWKNYSCTLTGRKTITITEVTNSTTEQLDYSNRVIQMGLASGHLIVVTTKQCHIHSSTSWNTPVVFDLKDSIVYMILISERCFCLVERSGINIYSYLGRLLASPRWGSMRLDVLARSSISLGPDTLAVIDQNDHKTIHIFELPTGIAVRSSSEHSTMTVTHTMAASEIVLSQSGLLAERQLAMIDFNKDLYILTVKDSKLKLKKIAVQVSGITWCEDVAILVALREGRLIIFGSPRTSAFLSLTTIVRDVSDLGKNPKLIRAEEGCVVIRRGDGSLLHIAISPFPMQLARKVAANQWSQALKLCRIIKDDTLWACLAALSWESKELAVAEEAFAIIKQPHQVEYIQQLKNPTQIESNQD
ncbi:intraflagellar transport protein Oseg5 [Arctopsyche grandis]|uniref:intraflagellar transport protein Oseg5 n=1 Tax=Arctopsyche grandis TaxID=121162 RepID=UPI00406D7EBD